MLYTITLEQLAPSDNFYRRLNKAINLNRLYKRTQKYYDSEGQENTDPVVFQDLFNWVYQQYQQLQKASGALR